METYIPIIITAAVIAVFVILAARGKKDIIYKMLYSLVNEAEEMFGSQTGKLKFAYVIERVYAMLPGIFKVFITYQTLEKWIEKALAEAKEHWAEQAGIDTDSPVTVKGFSAE